MTTLTIYTASDGLHLLDKDLYLAYEEEISKHPEDPGIIFYDIYGRNIDINNIGQAVLYKITNTIIANAKLHSIKMLKINNDAEFKIEEGHYIIDNYISHFKIDEDLFDDTLDTYRHVAYL